MADVIAFVLEFDAVLAAEQFGDVLDVAKRVAEDGLVGSAKVWLLPIELPLLVFVRHGMQREVHRSHVERAHFGEKAAAAAMRSSIVIMKLPPVVMLTTALVIV